MKQSTGTFTVVRCYDPAIDLADDESGAVLARYAERRDMRDLRFVDPAVAKPIVYHCRRLTLSQRRHVTGALDVAERHRRAFAYGVTRIENWPDESGSLTTWQTRDESKPIRDADLERFAEDDVQEIGYVVERQSFLAQGVPLRLPVLGTSRDACMAVLLQYAERKRDAETQTDAP